MKKLTSAILMLSILLSSLVLTLPASAAKTELDIKWNSGYAVISIHNPYNLVEGYVASANYSSTDVFTVPKKGTKLTWTDPDGFAPCSVLTVSSWKQEGGEWVIDVDGPLFVGAGGKSGTITETKSGSSVVYSYTTYKDNENLRLCVNGKNVDIKVYAEASQGKSSWERALDMYYDEPPMPVSATTGAPVSATVLEDVQWNYGYVGSQSHSSSANKISNGSINYLYSDVITVPKAGTTVYFYDDDCSDGTASSNAAVFSHWKKSGSNWVIDLSKPSIDGSQASRTKVGNYYLYSYTTTENNENLRLCYRSSLTDYTISVRPYKVYLASSAEMTPVTETGKFTDAAFTDASGANQTYKVFLPDNLANKPGCPIIFNISDSTEIVDALIENKTEAAVFSFYGNDTEAQGFIDTVISAYSLKKTFLYLIGSTELNKSCGDLFVNSITGVSGHSSALDAGKALLSKAPVYEKKLEGLTMLAMGDSYFAGDGIGKDCTWVNMLGNKYGMHFNNYGIGGSTISAFVTTNNPMVVRIKQMEKVDADIILFEGGRNDYNKQVPLGETSDTGIKSFYGALNYSLDYLRKTYPNALIILVTPWKYSSTNELGYSNVTYAKAMRTIAEERNDPHIVCLYAADPAITGVDMTNASFRAQYCNTPTDVSHLNVEGMNLVFPKMEAFVAQAYADFIKATQPEATEEVTTEAPAPITTEELTEAPTAAPETIPAPAESDNEITEPAIDNGGCGSFAACGTVIAVICGAWITLKKKN